MFERIKNKIGGGQEKVSDLYVDTLNKLRDAEYGLLKKLGLENNPDMVEGIEYKVEDLAHLFTADSKEYEDDEKRKQIKTEVGKGLMGRSLLYLGKAMEKFGIEGSEVVNKYGVFLIGKSIKELEELTKDLYKITEKPEETETEEVSSTEKPIDYKSEMSLTEYLNELDKDKREEFNEKLARAVHKNGKQEEVDLSYKDKEGNVTDKYVDVLELIRVPYKIKIKNGEVEPVYYEWYVTPGDETVPEDYVDPTKDAQPSDEELIKWELYLSEPKESIEYEKILESIWNLWNNWENELKYQQPTEEPEEKLEETKTEEVGEEYDFNTIQEALEDALKNRKRDRRKEDYIPYKDSIKGTTSNYLENLKKIEGEQGVKNYLDWVKNATEKFNIEDEEIWVDKYLEEAKKPTEEGIKEWEELNREIYAHLITNLLKEEKNEVDNIPHTISKQQDEKATTDPVVDALIYMAKVIANEQKNK